MQKFNVTRDPQSALKLLIAGRLWAKVQNVAAPIHNSALYPLCGHKRKTWTLNGLNFVLYVSIHFVISASENC